MLGITLHLPSERREVYWDNLILKVFTNLAPPQEGFFNGKRKDVFNMAVATAERLKDSVNIGSLLNGIRSLAKTNETPNVIPWEAIWNSGIPHEVILTTAGQCFKYEAALLYPVTPKQNKGVAWWRKQARRELLGHLRQISQSRDVYKSLRQAHKIIPLDTQEHLSDKWQRFQDNIRIGGDRLLKALIVSGVS